MSKLENSINTFSKILEGKGRDQLYDDHMNEVLRAAKSWSVLMKELPTHYTTDFIQDSYPALAWAYDQATKQYNEGTLNDTQET